MGSYPGLCKGCTRVADAGLRRPAIRLRLTISAVADQESMSAHDLGEMPGFDPNRNLPPQRNGRSTMKVTGRCAGRIDAA